MIIEFQQGCDDARELGCLAFYRKLTLGCPSCGSCSSMVGVVEV